jgi:hypothetical protein
MFEGSVSEGETFDPAIYNEEMSMFFLSSETLGTPAMEYVEEMSRFFPSFVFYPLSLSHTHTLTL